MSVSDLVGFVQVKDFPLFVHSKLSLRDYYVSSESPVARVIRPDMTYVGNIPGDSWTVFIFNHSTYMPVSHARLVASHQRTSGAQLSDIVYTPVILDTGKYDGVRRILFGAGLEFWLHRVLLLDALSFLSHGQLSQPLDRFILVDVDDIFVGPSGVRLTEPDVMV